MKMTNLPISMAIWKTVKQVSGFSEVSQMTDFVMNMWAEILHAPKHNYDDIRN